MSGIAGIFAPGGQDVVEGMLDRMAHRGPAGRKIIETEGATLGIAWTGLQETSATVLEQEQILRDEAGSEHCAEVKISGGHPSLMRDPLGVAPLYYGTNSEGVLGFASEVKALAEFTPNVSELPPGYRFDGNRLDLYFQLKEKPPVDDPVEVIIEELYRRLAAAVEKRINGDMMGSWLSGGLDSSTLAALARPHVRILHTFAAGLAGAPDLEFAREVAAFIDSQHHEVVLTLDSMLEVLPKVIYHLESFDALLVRSSITNYMAAKLASDYVAEVFSGEGGDELFAGYEYLKALDPAMLPGELIDITGRLHNTALQRVDRSAAAHGTVAHVAFLDPDVVEYAHRIPVKYKIRDGVEKWILRRAIEGKLPDRVLNRTKAKFWEGAGVKEHLAQYAEGHITSDDFNRERTLKNGWLLDSKEELMYYRIFKEYFGNLENLSWMGRTKK
ncbi:MAG: hypothetical protein QG657_1613 [Acidobacteriota bacterium]|nr:hypothetical protein [Acidobacteriota bacterium]